MHQRTAGLLLHPTSLPGRFGTGDLGPGAERFLDWAAAAGLGVWQVLPLGPPVAFHSPYGCLSAFAGNPLLISPERLCEDGLLQAAELDGAPLAARPDRADFDAQAGWKEGLLRRAWERFQGPAGEPLRADLEHFRQAPVQRGWLADWELFCALRERYGQRPWTQWDAPLARREPQALSQARRELEPALAYHGFVQWLFDRQWQRLRHEARQRGLRILGDLPIYVAGDSADVWSHPYLFQLDEQGAQLAQAGVPPDALSADGQLWGNPLYRWDRLAEDDYAWWVARLAANLRQADLVRLDHFRGFAGYWSVPMGDPRGAAAGRWVPGPGAALFAAFRRHLGQLPLIAEDLGYITEDVHQLRREAGLPCMRVLQFGFPDTASDHAPHHLERATALYTGTHDNDTAVGWFRALAPDARRQLLDYLGAPDEVEVHWHLIRLACTSVAELAIVPLQDVLGLGSEARMNVPGRALGNWAWRARPEQLRPETAARLRHLIEISGRTRLAPAST